MKKELHRIANSFQFKAMSLKLLLLFLICTANFQLASAQRFPVQVNQSLIPPYNTKLNSYATSTDVKLRLFLTLTDVNVSNRQVQLKLKIQGKGLNIQSADFVTGASPIFLNGGTQQQFTNLDLAPYFRLNNLLGINPQQYNQPLPDGSYKICWEVYDALTNQLISNTNTGCSNIFLLLNDPPFLNLPNRGDQLTDIQPTNIVFQWTPRHANATNVSYEFEIRELWDKQIDPQAAFLASPPFHTETSFSTTLLYNIGKPTLIPGRTYGWRVRAKSTTGLSENSVFKNNGYSEIFYFTFTNQCFPPTFTLAEPIDKRRVKINWQTHPDHNRYHVQYKRADVADAEWFEAFSYNNQVEIANLQDGVTYNFRVGGTCHALTDFEQAFSYSAVNQFTMPTADESLSYSCGIVPEITITNTNPLDNIGVNETFTAGDFPVTIKQIEGGNGNYSGTGFIVVPYLADTKIAVEFNNIKINTDYQLYDGIIRTTYDPTWSGVEDFGDLFNGGDGQVNTNEVKFPIAQILIDPNGDILIVGEGGAPIVELPGGEDYTITDSNGQIWSVDEQGNVTSMGTQAQGGSSTANNTNGVNSNGEATSITAQEVLVTFTQATTAKHPNKYGFDAYQNSQPQTKDLYKSLGDNYYMPYKAVAKGQTDYIIANISITTDSIQPKDIVFKTKDGVALTKVDSTTTTYTLALKGVLSDANIETQAVIKQDGNYQIAGAFIQYQSTIKNVDVVLVNTANANTETIKNHLKRIYQQAMVNLNITEINNFTSTLNNLTPNGSIESGESGFLANYTQQQQAINSALKSRPDYKQSAYYLILTDKTPSKANQKGLMPIGRQFGYIYSVNSKTIAHELGHGAFQLKHPFSTHSLYKWNEGDTNWLMDYPNSATHLPYAHWKNIHNPNIRIGVFDGDSEGELAGGYGLSPDFKLFSTSTNKIISNKEVSDPFITGFVHLEKQYNWRSVDGVRGYYLKDKDSLFNNYKTQVNNDAKIWLTYNNNATCSQRVAVRTTYDKVKDFIIAKNRTGLVSYTKNTNIPPKDNNDKKQAEYYISYCSGSSQPSSGRCKQFDYYTEIQANDQTRVNEALQQAITSINSSKNTLDRDLGSFSHIVLAKNSSNSNPLNNLQMEIIEDKLHLLAYGESKDKYMVVTFLQLDENNKKYDNVQLRNLAQKAVDEAQSDSKIVHVLVTYSNYESMFGVGLFNNDVCYNIGYAESEIGLVGNNPLDLKQSIYQNIINVFKSIEKPLIVTKYYQYANGNLQSYKYKTKQNIRGYGFIKHLSFYRSRALVNAVSKRQGCSDKHNQCESRCGENDGGCYNRCSNNYNLCIDNIKVVLNEALDKEMAINGLGNEILWQEENISDIATFRELYMDFDGSKSSDGEIDVNTDGNITFQLWKKTVESWTWWSQVEVATGFGTVLDKKKHFYDFKSLALLDDVVYGALDVASFIPGADNVTDPVGAIYAGVIRNDATNFTIYSLSSAVPFVGAAYIKGGAKLGKNADELWGIVAKKANNTQGFILESRKIKDIKPNEFQITSIIHSGDKKVIDKVNATAATENYVDSDFVRKQLDVLANAGDDITTLLLKSGEDFTVLTNARKLPGTAAGNGKNISGTWLRGTEGNAGLFPQSIANQLKNQQFSTFDKFREAFWKAVANDSHLASQFSSSNLTRMQNGFAPFVKQSQQLGGQTKYILHHKTPINQGGAVYNMDNLYIVTPKYHKEILDPAYHYGYGY
ncbi:hypothetical protein FEZ18_03365 [Oceanihabitans sp. IOP_32]|uniref:hypothetical protein n=1 Tax=Oceanihabitans sp. IOP_32 TaxID=2529032 RepID=UPI0012934F31|nr:hypothetical protein [Oceanihabitans sp. IOP_32]QFZ53916.1 hypothetical protein FEZ18_03365 [Oceanihabitans sp. IOP_32]